MRLSLVALALRSAPPDRGWSAFEAMLLGSLPRSIGRRSVDVPPFEVARRGATYPFAAPPCQQMSAGGLLLLGFLTCMDKENRR